MGTAKRERQKANRALKRTEQVRAQHRRKGVRLAIIGVGAVLAVFALVWIASRGGDDETTPVAEFPFGSDSVVDSTAVDVTTLPTTQPAAADVGCPPTDGSADPVTTFSGPPPFCLTPDASYSAVVTTNKGEFTIDLDAAQAPETVNNFVFLARWKYFDNTTCHRIIPGFVVQCGDPTGSGSGNPGYTIPDELPEAGEYELGSVAMANSSRPDSGGSQFFIITGANGAALPPSYSLFGDVTAGFDDAVVAMEAAGSESGTPAEDVEIVSVEIIEA